MSLGKPVFFSPTNTKDPRQPGHHEILTRVHSLDKVFVPFILDTANSTDPDQPIYSMLLSYEEHHDKTVFYVLTVQVLINFHAV